MTRRQLDALALSFERKYGTYDGWTALPSFGMAVQLAVALRDGLALPPGVDLDGTAPQVMALSKSMLAKGTFRLKVVFEPDPDATGPTYTA